MLEEVLARLTGSDGFALWLPFSTLILCGLGLPLPEDIVLVTAGFLGAQSGLSFVHVASVMYAGILVGDTATFCLGRFFGRGVMTSRLGRWVFSPERIQKAEKKFKTSGSSVIFVGRFLPGLRAAIFFSAGLLKFSVWKFWLMDGFAAVISAPLFVWVGEWAWLRYGQDLKLLEKTIGQTKLYFGFALALVLISFFSFKFFQTRKLKRKGNLG